MSIKPLSDWISSYETKLKEYYDACLIVPTTPIATFWQDWVATNTTGITSAPPYVGANGTFSPTAFAPVIFNPSMLPPASAKVLADAWKAFYLSITWAPMPAPAAPFTTILSVVSSPLGTNAAYGPLLAGLTAEFFILPPNPATAFLEKSTAIGTLFYTATLAGGIKLDGTDSDSDPASVPFSGVL